MEEGKKEEVQKGEAREKYVEVFNMVTQVLKI
jgi:hypothetical protein